MKLTAEFKPQNVTVSVNPQSMGIGFGNPIARDYVERDPYTGEYTVTPLVNNEIILETRNKRMTDNLKILKVPYSETANISGGNTATIGELNYG